MVKKKYIPIEKWEISTIGKSKYMKYMKYPPLVKSVLKKNNRVNWQSTGRTEVNRVFFDAHVLTKTVIGEIPKIMMSPAFRCLNGLRMYMVPKWWRS